MTPTLANRYSRGFTLLETIIYIALFGLLITGILSISYTLFEHGARSREKAYRETEVAFMTAKIRYVLAHALPTEEILTDLQPKVGSESTSTLSSDVGNFRFEHTGTELLYSDGAEPPTPLNSKRISVTDFLVTHEKSNEGPHILTIYLEINDETVQPFKIYFPF